ncbi:MAG: iron complex outermembrane receptor protein [Gammaproteobacteria bacterium]|jgi:iron complex outermembrane receptor protein
MKNLFSSIVFALLSANLQAQTQMDEMVVTGTKGEIEIRNIPASVSVVGQTEIQTAQQQLTLDESLRKVPGVFLQNSHNFSQAQRISIRGFGARSAFGIRGIKLIVDGIPATMPDGGGNVDEIDLGSASRIEVMRGPSSSLYGTAAGGVINVFTEDGPEHPFVEGKLSVGEFGFQQYQIKTGGQINQLNYMVNGSITDMDGYRENSFVDRKSLNSKLTYQIDPKAELVASINILDIPDMGDPGGLRDTEVETNRAAAAPNNLRFNGGESRSQQRLGLTYKRSLAENHEILFRNYYTFLDFANRLPFGGGIAESNGGQVQFDRTFMGGGGQYTYSEDVLDISLRFIAGFDIDSQSDDRKRFVNLDGGIRGDLTMDQLEEVLSMGAYVQSEFAVLENLNVTFGARYDDIDFDVTDNFLENNSGNDSGKSSFTKLSPRIGFLWDPVNWANMFLNISTAFETPTTTEFANPDGGGFNQNLKNQTANNFEVGMKGAFDGRLPIDYEVAVYKIKVKNELIPFEEDGFTGRTFFQNAGRSTRKGFEAGITAELFPVLTASLAYSYINAEFDLFRTAVVNLDGNKIPGIPNQHLHAELRFDEPNGWYSTLDFLYIDSFFADNENQIKTDPYAVSNFRLGYRKELEKWIVTPYLSVNNLLNEDYNSNTRLNAGFGRYFEPAPLRNIYGGVSARYTF